MVGEAHVAAVGLVGKAAEYRAEARLEAGDQNLGRGWVTKAGIDGDEVALEVRNTVVLTEQVFGELSIAGMPDTEMVWSMAKWTGLRPVVPELRPYAETIAVAMPIQGLDVQDAYSDGPVTITADRRLIEIMSEPLKDSPGKRDFLDVGSSAVVRVNAPLLYLADDAAVPVIEAAMDRFALELQYSLATDPDGTPLPFQRQDLFTDPVAVRTVLVHGHGTGRTWLRSLDNPTIRSVATGPRLPLPRVPTDPGWTHGVRAWGRAVRETDRLAAVGALFEAVEFYAVGTKVRHLLSKDDTRLVNLALDSLRLAPEKRQRLADVLGRANEPPLKVRLEAALQTDRVPYSAEEIDRLWHLREYRNDAIHGRRLGAPDVDDLDLAKGLVNRMFAFRAWRHAANGILGPEPEPTP